MKKYALLKYRGFTIVEMMVVAVIIGIVCAIALPNFAKVRSNAYKNQCITNLQRITSAKEHWAMETGAADTDTPTAVQLDPYLKDGTSSLTCPLDTNKTFSTSYSINQINASPACSIMPSTHKLQ